MPTRIKSSQILDGSIVATDLHSAIAVNTTAAGTFASLTANGGLTVDNFTLDGTTLALSSGDMTLDSAGRVVLDAATDGDIRLHDGSSMYGQFFTSSDDMYIRGRRANAKHIFSGTADGSSFFNSLLIDYANSGRATFNENIVAGGVISTSNTTGSTNTTSGALTVAGGIGVAENAYIGGNVIVTGNLTVEGTQVTLNTSALDVEDKNITLNYHASSDTSASAGGAGITIQDAVDASNDASILWNATNDEFDFSHAITVPSTLTLTSNAPRIFLYEADSTDLNTALFSSGGKFTIRTTTDDDATRTTRLEVDHNNGNITFYDSAGGAGLVWDAGEGTDGALLIGGHTDLRTGSVAGRNDAQLSLESTNYHNAIFVENQNTANGYHLVLGKTRGTAVNAVTIVQAEDEIGSLTFAAADGTDLRPKVAQISAYVSAGTTPTTNAVSGELRFGTTSQAQDTTTHMVLNKDGRLGIGTLLPETLLDVQKSSTALYTSSMSGVPSYTPSDADMIQVRNSNTGLNDIYAGIWFETGTGATNTTGTDRSGRIALVVDNDSSYSSNFVFQTRGTAGTLTEKMRITQDGNIGIGTTTPSSQLVVAASNGGNGIETQVTTHATNNQYILAYDRTNSAYLNMEISTLNLSVATGVGSSKFKILADGKVGIGTNITPVHKLDVDGSIGTRQVRHSVRPSLNLDFAKTKQLDPRISFYRDSIATYCDSKGVLQYSNVNEPRFDHDPITGESKGLHIEEDRTNSALASTQDLPIDFNNMIVGRRDVGPAPDGTYTAHEVLATGGVSRHEVNIKYQGTANVVYTASVWVKALGAVTHLMLSRAGGSDKCNFDLINGTAGTPGGNAVPKVISYPNGWNRISITYTEGVTGTRSTYMSPGAADGSSSVYNNLDGNNVNGVLLWGEQVEAGAFVTSYVPRDVKFISRAGNARYQDKYGKLVVAPKDSPRYGYRWNGRRYVETGLIVEPNTTQIAPDSEGIGGSYYLNGYTRTTISTVLPTGETGSCRKMTMNNGQTASAATGMGYYLGLMPRTQNTVYNTSFFVKALDEDGFRVRDGLSSGAFLDVNLTTGVIASHNTAVFKNVRSDKYSDGWWRVSFDYKYTGSTSTSSWLALRSSNDGDGTKGYAIWGFQVTTDRLTSYIPNPANVYSYVTMIGDTTSAKSYTRDNDFAEMLHVGDLIPQPLGTVYTEFAADEPSGSFGGIFEILANIGQTNGIDHRYTSSAVQFYATNNYAIAVGGPITPGVFTKTSLAYDFDSIVNSQTARDGVQTSGNTVHIFDLDLKHIRFGSIDFNTAYQLNGHMKSFRLYPERMDNAEIVALTENN